MRRAESVINQDTPQKTKEIGEYFLIGSIYQFKSSKQKTTKSAAKVNCW